MPLSVTDAARAHVGGNLARILEARHYETFSARSFSFKLIDKKRDSMLFLNELRPPPRPKTQDPRPKTQDPRPSPSPSPSPRRAGRTAAAAAARAWSAFLSLQAV
ncbi:hypothetical protein F2Q70_00036120 [Brassica cretica]|uniref:Uncharacterized protein n=1 Tax=Brassica cretica TaxID=69181 RepID=A0A8S9JRE9_BRACR|nr:hypothetical protein F2Q70_00036120 [Brassica cretica]KAF3527829.1 hypothetical protein DY000_02040671 [Brassica cretica]